MYLCLFIILGLCMGSFYLVLATRGSVGESIIKPASHCDNCKHKLKFYELIPIFSYLFLRGKCSQCHKKISPLNILVELATGILFGLGYYLYGFSYEMFAFLVISSLMVVIFISDFKYLVILDMPLIISSILIIVLKFIYFSFKGGFDAIICGLVLFIFMLLVKLVGDRVYKRESLGWGDIKLSFFIGITLGIRLGFSAFIIGSLFALPYALYYMFKKKEKEIPYGPFLIFGVFIVFIFMEYISNFINMLFIFN